VRERVLLVQIRTTGKSLNLGYGEGSAGCAALRRDGTEDTHCTGEASQVFLVDERNHSPWVLNDDVEREQEICAKRASEGERGTRGVQEAPEHNHQLRLNLD